jgi:hypothetical protein
MRGSYRGQVLQMSRVLEGPQRQAVTEAWVNLVNHEQATTATTGLGHHKLAMQVPTGTAAPRHQAIMDGTTNTDLQEVGPQMVEIHMQASRRRVGRHDTAPVASKYPRIISDAVPRFSETLRHLSFMHIRKISCCFIIDHISEA